MLIVSDRPLYIAEVLNPPNTPFEIDDANGTRLIQDGVARHARPPRILYETATPEQNAAALREQGVTCVCVTRNRREWISKAIASYLAQSYQPRELLIIADGEDIQDLVPERPDIRLIHVEEGRNIGMKRNFALEHARGKYIAHWDDDDISAPDRLLDQMDRITRSGRPVTGYHQVDFTADSSWLRWTGDADHAAGSSLLYEREWALQFPFKPLQVGEDGEFVAAAVARKAFTSAPANGLLTATSHPANTSPRTLDSRWAPLERSATGLTVVIPSKTLANLIPCVEAVHKHEPDARIVVVDDGIEIEGVPSGSELSDLFLGPSVHSLAKVGVIAGERPFIFSRNMNSGIRAAGRDDVLLLNDDAILQTPRGFSLLQKAAAEHPEFGIIGATTNNVGNSNQKPHAVGLRQDPRMVCFIAVLIPRTTLDKIGFMDERFTAYGFDDDDFCYRVRRAGLKIGIHDGCFVDHASLKSTFRGDPRTPAQLQDGRRIFEQKWGTYPL